MIVHSNVYLIVAVMSASIFLTANSYISQGSTILDTKFFAILGDASYSLYMLHALFLTVGINMIWPHISTAQVSLEYGCILLAVTTAFSTIVFSIFEKPARDFLSGRALSPSALSLPSQR
jgi:peptidoglycan/LPS O-acetylase OafA/YrhL